MISERLLRKWRKEALLLRDHKGKGIDQMMDNVSIGDTIVQAEKILRLTQELLDQHLLKK